MTFDLDRWRARLRADSDGWWAHARRAGAESVYASLSAAVLWPLVEAAQKGELMPVLLALGAVTGGVGANLISAQIQRWKDRSEQAGEADIAAWVDARVAGDADLRRALDDILERLDAVAAVRSMLGDRDRRAFTEALRADLERLGNLGRFEDAFHGTVAGDVFEIIARLPAGMRSKDDIDRQMREERETWGTG